MSQMSSKCSFPAAGGGDVWEQNRVITWVWKEEQPPSSDPGPHCRLCIVQKCLDASLGFKLLKIMDFQTKMEELFQKVRFEAVLRHWQAVQPAALEPAGSAAGSFCDLGVNDSASFFI